MKSRTEQFNLTPMFRQYLQIKQQYPDTLLLFRMGDFYETFFEDAKLTSKILGITLTSRNKGVENPVPLAGFPHHALDTYIDKLIKNGLKIAICEQVEDPKLAKGIVKREVVQIITPGTILDKEFLNSKKNNFLCAICEKKYDFGLAFIDASTGEFHFTELEKSELVNEILRITPQEILYPSGQKIPKQDYITSQYPTTFTEFDIWHYDYEEASERLKKHFSVSSLDGFGAEGKYSGICAAGAVLAYLEKLKNNKLSHITSLHYYSTKNILQIDNLSRRNLELTQSIRSGDRYGTFIDVFDKTQTPMGARKFINWLYNPLIDVDKINRRLNALRELVDDIITTKEIRGLLSNIGDLERILSKIGTLRVKPRDLIALKEFLQYAPNISLKLKDFKSDLLSELRTSLESDYANTRQELVMFIDNAIYERPNTVITEGGVIKDGYNPELDELRLISRDGKKWIAQLEKKEKDRTKIPSLKISFNKVFGYYIEVTKTHIDKVPEHYIRKQTLVNSERYISPELKEYENKVLGAEERIKQIEYSLFLEIRTAMVQYIPAIKEVVDVIAVLDVLTNFAYIAYYNNYCQPVVDNGFKIEIKLGRHPVIERLLGDKPFIPNDVYMDNESDKILIITGPNMSGKSTYLRQIGLLVLMAHMGSFIPAKSAHIGIVDKIFTRVGASDNLALGQSTFLVEMIETANILHNSTPRSLILLDEIGRGTSTFDGLSIAWAVVEYIHENDKISAKTLFATHYHELTELADIFKGVKNYNVSVKDTNDEIIFLYKIAKGGADQSYGIQVAQLAGVPKPVINRAKEILHNLERNELNPNSISKRTKRKRKMEYAQVNLFDIH
ncbi:MAG: DNA mismatch repair protein MutS [Candidatus Cloacimonadota bacterium]|nr:MAG: DNA mismatch repair protein MutS [Candidatus Cloacimonadota bacterium]